MVCKCYVQVLIFPISHRPVCASRPLSAVPCPPFHTPQPHPKWSQVKQSMHAILDILWMARRWYGYTNKGWSRTPGKSYRKQKCIKHLYQQHTRRDTKHIQTITETTKKQLEYQSMLIFVETMLECNMSKRIRYKLMYLNIS